MCERNGAREFGSGIGRIANCPVFLTLLNMLIPKTRGFYKWVLILKLACDNNLSFRYYTYQRNRS